MPGKKKFLYFLKLDIYFDTENNLDNSEPWNGIQSDLLIGQRGMGNDRN